MGVVAARDRHPRRELKLGRQAARGAGARVAGVQSRPAQRLPRAPVRFQGEAAARARLCARRAWQAGCARRRRSGRMRRAGIRRARIHGPRRMAALGRLSVRHTLRQGRRAPVAESAGQSLHRAHGRRRAFPGRGPSVQGHSAAGARLPAGAGGRGPARSQGLRSLRPQAHAQDGDRDRRPARRFSGALDARRGRNAGQWRGRRRRDRPRPARAARRVLAVSAGRPCASRRNRAARQRAQPDGRLDGRRGGSAALQRARRLREACRARPRRDSRVRGAHRALRGERERRQRRARLGAGCDRAARHPRREPGADRLARRPDQLETRSGPVRVRFAKPLGRQRRSRRDVYRKFCRHAGRPQCHRSHRELFPRRRPGGIPLRSLAARAGRRVSQGLDPGRQIERRQASVEGDLAKFPFADPGSGIFSVVAKVTGAELRYADGWPQASGISGDLIFEGKSMRVAASKASVLDVQASSVLASIPDLFHDAHVEVEVRAEDQTRDFLRFIAQSPVTKALDGVTDGMSAVGKGRLALQLDIPIRDPETFKLAGDYQLVDNEIRADPNLPPFSHTNGRFEFTESAVSARALSAQFLGGPATISVATRADGMIVGNARGTANAAHIPRAWGEGLLQRVSGATAWQGTITGARGRPVTFVVQSQLTGVAADLPPPLAKTAVEPMPLRFERVIDPGPPRTETIKVSLGPAVEVAIQRRRYGPGSVVERGVISLNEPAVLPEREGLTVTGSLPYVDADRWRELLGGKGDSSFSPALDLKIAALDFVGRRLNDVALRASTNASEWTANISAKELEGEIVSRSEGRGRIVARLKRFSLPEATPGKKEDAPLRDLPALDIVADNLILNGNNLGRLELVAVNQALDWNIEKLVLTGPESTLTVKGGVWQGRALQPKVNLKDIKLEIGDVGKYLERMGYPGTVRRGTAQLEGDLSWVGSPQSLDYATLSGNLLLNAENGQFLKAEPGAAKLIGILSLPSLITLDFRELFGRGFAFDTISTRATIANGVLSAKEFHMQGPSAEVTMSGEVDLNRETQNLHVSVKPSVGNSISSIVAVVVNPIWGLGAFILDKVLKNPLGQVLTFEYRVTGTWTKPEVAPLKAEVRNADPSQQQSPQ